MRTLDPEKVVRNFLDTEGRLKQIPVKQAKLQIVLAHLAEQFEPNRRYPESEVNEVLKRFHEDFCTLRRNLVDYRLLDRANGEYWRHLTENSTDACNGPQ
ncbi:MAG TPA: DUF2087 domain-containing protein [Symbiobacteriaceae bacterium]|nr:DUF2087 domain-containing protein [Symbiobacteriaceae bacterium]